MSRFSFFSTMSVAALTSIFIYLLVGKILHVMSLTQPRLQRVIGVRTLSMTYYLPFLWLPGIWSMLSGSAPPAATATTAASPQENAARAGQQQTTGGNGAAPRPPPRSFFEYLMHGAGYVCCKARTRLVSRTCCLGLFLPVRRVSAHQQLALSTLYVSVRAFRCSARPRGQNPRSSTNDKFSAARNCSLFPSTGR